MDSITLNVVSLVCLFTLATLIPFASSISATAADLPLTANSQIHLATTAEAGDALTERDTYINALGPFDRQARLRSDKPVSAATLLAFTKLQAMPWSEAQRAKVTKAIASLREKFQPFDLPFPEKVVLVHTSGREEGDAAYCRGNAIFLPTKFLRGSDTGAFERLLTHELFHILSRHNPLLRRDLYAIVGFKPCGEVSLPPTLIDRRITNPDAFRLDFFIELNRTDEEEPVAAVPVLFATPGDYDAKSEKTFFSYLTFRLMTLTKLDGAYVPRLIDGEPELLDPKSEPSYHKQIGRNTGYIIHAEEVLADNFVHMVFEKPDLPTPRIVEQMRQRLARSP